jgi:two-component system, OmpR family, KDP operon response regulator KdpE
VLDFLEVLAEVNAVPETILIVDDDVTILWLIGTLLKHHGFLPVTSQSPIESLRLAKEQPPDLILLDVMMPEMDGWELCRRLREFTDAPVIFITAKGTIPDVVKGLEIGGDDYLIKPFDNHELVARIKAHLRRRKALPESDQELTFGNGSLKINLPAREVTVSGRQVNLTPTEFSLLTLLAKNAGRVLTRGELISQVWGSENPASLESLKLYVYYLRRKIERDPEKPELILTSRGVGYRFANK